MHRLPNIHTHESKAKQQLVTHCVAVFTIAQVESGGMEETRMWAVSNRKAKIRNELVQCAATNKALCFDCFTPCFSVCDLWIFCCRFAGKVPFFAFCSLYFGCIVHITIGVRLHSAENFKLAFAKRWKPKYILFFGLSMPSAELSSNKPTCKFYVSIVQISLHIFLLLPLLLLWLLLEFMNIFSPPLSIWSVVF